MSTKCRLLIIIISYSFSYIYCSSRFFLYYFSRRVRIWAEPAVVEQAASDFSETEEFLQAAEALTCPYAWTRYDVLCMPPSFPYGGMENPCLTFVTPTLLTGDRSLADVIAHEVRFQ